MSSAPVLRDPESRSVCPVVRDGGVDDLDAVMEIMTAAFPAELGEAWTRSQCAGILPLAGVALRLAEQPVGHVVGFALDRQVADEAELLLIAVYPTARRAGVGEILVRDFIDRNRAAGATRLHLEVRDGNPAESLYHRLGFDTVGRRSNYYSGIDGQRADALTLVQSSKD